MGCRGTLLDCYSEWSRVLSPSLVCFAMLVCVAVMSGCEVTDPDMVFDGCVNAGGAYMKPDQTKEVLCASKADTMLALPCAPADRE